MTSYDKSTLEKLLSGSKEANLVSSAVQTLYEVYLNCFDEWVKSYKK